VKLPAGSESAITDRDFTIATVVAPSALKRSEAAGGEGEEEVEETEVTEQKAETVEGETEQSEE
jgi:large subunit ribosomal protein L25